MVNNFASFWEKGRITATALLPVVFFGAEYLRFKPLVFAETALMIIILLLSLHDARGISRLMGYLLIAVSLAVFF